MAANLTSNLLKQSRIACNRLQAAGFATQTANLPKTMKALSALGEGKLGIKEKPLPELQEGFVMVDVHSVALNPTDWKAAKLIAPPGVTMGNDFAGTICAVGPGGDKSQIGKRIAGFLTGSRDDKIGGAFAEYLKVERELAWEIPENASFDEAAAIGGIGSQTAAMALYHRLGLPYPGKQKSGENHTILVWAGSTSVGMYAIQLAKASGARVVTTASPKNHDLVKSFGADAVFDYRDPDVVQKIKDWAGDKPVSGGLDCISEKGSIELSAACLGPAGGSLVTLIPPNNNKIPDNVKLEWIVVLTVFGRELFLGGKTWPANAEAKAQMVEWLPYTTQVIEKGQLKSNPLRKCPGTLEGIPQGLQYLQDGKNSAEKLVYRVKEDFSPEAEPLR